MKKITILTTTLILTINIFAQNLHIEELNKQLVLQTTYVEKVKLFTTLIELYRSEMLYNKASSLNNTFLELAKKNNSQVDITLAYLNEGLIHINQKQYDKASAYLDSTIISASKTKEKNALAYSEFLKFYLTTKIGDNKKAMEHGLKTLSLLDESADDFLLEFKTYYLLYGIFAEWNDINNAKYYAQKALDAAIKSNNQNDISNAYNALAAIYNTQYQLHKNEKDLNTTLAYCDKVDSLYTKFPGQVSNYTMCIALNNKASYLLEHSSTISPEIRKEIEYYINKSLHISSKLTQAQSTQAAGLGMLAYLAEQDGDLEKAEQYLLKAYAILLVENPPYYHILSRVVAELSELYEQKGDLTQALQYQKQLNQYKALLFNQSEAEVVKKLEVQYQSEKKEQEIQRLKDREENQQKRKLLYIGIAIIAIIGAFYMFQSYYFKLKYAVEQEKQLRTANQEAELQIKFEKEEQNRLKIEQELLALKQQKLQDEVLANQLQLAHKNNVFQQLKEKIDDNNPIDLKQIIRDETRLDNEFEKAKFQIQEIHPNFFKSLSLQSKHKLTLLDLKYCAYLYLGMDTKQIAQILNIEAKSVRMTKYRLKQKFGLDTNTDLIDFLKNLEIA